MSYKETKVYYQHLFEDRLKDITNAIWECEDKLRPDHPVRRELYKLRCAAGDIIMMNRTNKDWPQMEWVHDATYIKVPSAVDHIDVTIKVGEHD